MHVGHMAHLKAINMVLFIEGGRNKKEKEGKKKGEGKKGKKEMKRKEREREGEGEKRTSKFSSDRRFDGRNSSDREAKFIYATIATRRCLMSKKHIEFLVHLYDFITM